MPEQNKTINQQLENNFMYHAPKEGQPEKYEATVAITNLETAMFWANASIARN